MLLKLVRNALGSIIVGINYITLPKPKLRNKKDQQAVVEKSKRLLLYQFQACPFCIKTRRAIHRLNVPIAYRDASKEPARTELLSGGGKVTVPCLRIETDHGVQWMYESEDIIRYLEQQFV